MRKRVVGRKLNRSHGHRKSMRRNLLQALFLHGKIKTTLVKAKEIKSQAEKLITKARTNSQAARTVAHRWLYDEAVITKLFDEIAPRYLGHPGGYTRIVKLGPRQGDSTEEAIIELITVVTPTKEQPKAEKKTQKKTPSTKKDEAK